ncbi:tRNA uridine-5-carboxymethylaminomethyl(34) synthesis GTPase MnmE [Pontixanthobacter aquaemixtae]|uniref:tRNA modification GTPase MnmE n=1 Tax=Pontixanthobacter aquaemixtae TaxID=1958940 RepID=A0A844ZVW9_9SPHN|nr:tRNA uridine-5-carboxymethylaminomethyl(34) synthesis GTPase MnmE [Pontixanthobacter aquaemixtae]MXO91412.1 tRNA uridine-5-carboxymethylaminomethyl(34) synthesis GTPase MnmE [Pontixanthobacter aquaemixtae]
MDTIFALSSGSPPAGIAVIRVSGPKAAIALEGLAGAMPEPRRATARTLRDNQGSPLDEALVLWLPGPGTATGEDLVELHLHGGRAVVAAIEAALGAIGGLRKAGPGEFTRRAFANGRIDLAEAEGLADLLSAETELQRRSALAMAGGALSRWAEAWRETVLKLSAQVEAVLDFSDEDDVAALPAAFSAQVTEFASELSDFLARPRADKLHEGFRVVLAGPPNAGKSTLFNALLEDEAAIVTPTAGTTRDVLERSVAMGGVPFTFVDTAGLRASTEDAIETIGIERARQQSDLADLVLWLGEEGQGPEGAWEIDPKCDSVDHVQKSAPFLRISAATGEGIAELREELIERARGAMPAPGAVALNARQHDVVAEAHDALMGIESESDPLLIGERLRLVRLAFDRLLGRTSTEDMLDTLFGRFCIGK